MSRHRSTGFTLLELMIVIMILALTVGMSAPAVNSNWDKARDGRFLRRFMGNCALARQKALETGRPNELVIRRDERRYSADGEIWQDIPRNVKISAQGLRASTDSFALSFYPDGSTSSALLRVRMDEMRTYDIELNPLTGNAVLLRESESR